MISGKCLNLLVLYSVLTKIIATENSSPFPEIATTSNCSLENEEYVSGQTEDPYIAKLKKKYLLLLSASPCNVTSIINDNNNYWASNSDVLGTRNTFASDFEAHIKNSKPITYTIYTTHKVVIPVGLILSIIVAIYKCYKRENERSVEEPEQLCSQNQEDNFIVSVPENVIPLPPPPVQQDGQKLDTDNGNDTEPPPPSYSDAVIQPPPPTYEEITEERNYSTKV